GNKKKVGIVSAIMTSPKLIIMDEPTSGLDPLIQQAFYDILKEENSRGATVFFSSHVLSEVQKLCDRVAILKEGQLIGIQSIKELRESGYKKVSLSAKEAIPRDFFDLSGIANYAETADKTSVSFIITEISRRLLTSFTCCIWTMCFWKSPLWRKSSCTTMRKEVSGMVILKYELKRHRKYILGWAIALALCVFVMTPTYYSFMDVSTGDLYETLGTSDFYKGVGVSMEYLTSPLGIYAFLTSFFMIASGIFGMHFGIAIHTKECSERTSEYLFTKPHTRKTIYWAKAFTVFFGVVVVSMVYLLASFLALALFRSGIDWGEFFLIALSLMLVTLFLAAMGLLVGILFSRNRSPLLTAGLIVFVEYCVTSFSNIVSNRAISFLSPYSFFSAAEISKSGFYELDYLGWCVLLFALFLVLSYRVFLKKDIQFRS
ncbi:MAG: ABC transporter permease subunit, partial [Clostridia bacterium]